MIEFNEISLNKLIALLIIAILIFIAHKLISRFGIKLIKNEHQQGLMRLYVPLLTNIVWIVFFLYLIYELALINLIISIFISGLILLFTWNNIKDFIQGTIFKLQKGNIIGQQIKVGSYSGEVIKMGHTQIDILLENGEIIQYPHSKLTNQVIGISANIKHFKHCSLNFSVPLTKEIEKLKKQITVHLLNIPWIVSTMNIKIEIVGQDSDKINLKIIAYTLDKRFIPKIQHAFDLFVFKPE